jgi:oligosaccharide repeat unit polymerase
VSGCGMTALRGKTVVVFLIVLAVTLGLLVVAIEGTDVSVTGFLRGCLIALLCIPSLVSLWRDGKIDFFFPPVLFSFVIFIGHILPLSQFVRGDDVFSEAWPYSFQSFRESLDKALLTTVLGVLAFYLGFALPLHQGRERSSHKIVMRPTRLRLIGVLYTLCGLGLFAAGTVLIGGPSALIAGLADRVRAFAGLNYLFMAPILLLAFGLVWWIHVLQERRPSDLRFWAYMACALLLSGLMGNRANTFIVILAGVIVYHLLYRPISLPIVIALFCAGAAGLVAFKLYFREYLILGEIISLGPHASLEDVWSFFTRALGGEFYQIQALTILMDAMPDLISFQNGATYLFLLVAPIPSSIWPAKLDILVSPAVFTLALWPQRWLLEGTTVPTSLMGEMYMNFGTAGVVLGMIAFGALYKFVYVRARNRHPRAVLAFSILLANMIHYIRADFPAATVLFLIVGSLSYFALRWAAKDTAARLKMKPGDRGPWAVR